MSDDQYVCDLDDDALVLPCTKKSLVRILHRHFKDGEDFIQEKAMSTGGRPRHVYKLSGKCRLQVRALYALNSRHEVSNSEFNIDYIRRYAPKETETLDFVCTALSGAYTCARQQWFMNQKYRVDLYFPDQRVVVECDENGHVDREQAYERRREADLTRVLNCTFVRFNPDTDDFCMAVLLSRILRALMAAVQ